MTTETVQQLYPPTGSQVPLLGLYLRHRLAPQGMRPMIVSNFIVSLDGRISLPEPGSMRRRVPPQLSNERDLRLYAEVLAQSQVVVTTERHIRAAVAGRNCDLLRLDGARYPDLVQWRAEQGLEPQPAVAVVGSRLDLPVNRLDELPVGPIHIITTRAASVDRLAALQARVADVTVVQEDGGRIPGQAICDTLQAAGFGVAYCIGGGVLHRALLAAGCVQRLYVTRVLRFVGGTDYDTLVTGEELVPPVDMRLAELYLDQDGSDGRSQLFAVLDHR